MRLTTIFFLLIIFNGLSAQTSDSTYLKYLLHNSNVAKRAHYPGDSKNAIKTDMISIADGHLPFIWEHRFNNKWGVDAGPGLLLPYTFFDMFKTSSADGYPNFFPFVTNPNFENKKFGVSLRVEPKLYYKTEHQITALSHLNSISTFYNFKAYSKLLINEVGLSYTYIADTDKLAVQPTIAFSYVTQMPFYDVSDVKYVGKQSEDLSGYGLPKVSCFRLYLRFQVGYIFENHIKSNK